MKKIDVKDDYIGGFEAACKKAGLDPKEVFTKKGQWFGKLMGGIGRAVSKPVAAGAKAVGATQFGNDLATLNTLRGGADAKLGLRKFLEDSGLGHGNTRGGKLRVIKKGPDAYTLDYHIPTPGGKSAVRSVDLTHADLPPDIRSHFITSGKKSGLFDVESGAISGLENTAGQFAADPLYQTVGKYTAGTGVAAGTGLATLGAMSGGKKTTEFDPLSYKKPKGYAME